MWCHRVVGGVMHAPGDRLVGLQPEMTDKNFILVQNSVSEDEGTKGETEVYHRGAMGYPANRVTAEG